NTATISNVAVARQGNLLAVTAAVGSHAEVHLLDARSLARRTTAQLPLGAGIASTFSKDGKRLAASWSTARSPTDLYVIDTRTGKPEPLRKEPRPTLPPIQIDTTIVDISAFDGGKIPTNVHIPSKEQTKRHP